MRSGLSISRSRWTLTFLVSLCSASACRDASNDANLPMVSDSADVHIIHNTGADTGLPWIARERFRIGSTESGPAAFGLVTEQGVAGDTAGYVFVLDAGVARVHVFDRDGRYVQSFSRKGGGPGELKAPVSIAVNDSGVINVFDVGKLAFVRFAVDGTVQPEVRLPGVIASASRRPVATRWGIVAAGTDSVAEPDSDLTAGTDYWRMLYLWPHADSLPVRVAALHSKQPAFSLVGAPTCPIKIQTPPVFTTPPVWHVAGNAIVFSSQTKYVITKQAFDRGRLSIRRQMEPMRGTRESAATEIGEVSGSANGRSCSASATERADQAGWLGEIPWVTQLTISPTGEIFVLRRSPGVAPGFRIDVFSAAGSYRGTLPADFPFPTAWAGDGFLTLTRDADDRPVIVMYDIDRSRGGAGE